MFESNRKFTLCYETYQIYSTISIKNSANNFTTTFIYTYILKKKNIKITDIIYTYFAAEGLWNIDIIILFCNFDKTNS